MVTWVSVQLPTEVGHFWLDVLLHATGGLVFLYQELNPKPYKPITFITQPQTLIQQEHSLKNVDGGRYGLSMDSTS